MGRGLGSPQHLVPGGPKGITLIVVYGERAGRRRNFATFAKSAQPSYTYTAFPYQWNEEFIRTWAGGGDWEGTELSGADGVWEVERVPVVELDVLWDQRG